MDRGPEPPPRLISRARLPADTSRQGAVPDGAAWVVVIRVHTGGRESFNLTFVDDAGQMLHWVPCDTREQALQHGEELTGITPVEWERCDLELGGSSPAEWCRTLTGDRWKGRPWQLRRGLAHMWRRLRGPGRDPRH